VRVAGYSSFRGERLDGPALLALVEGLAANGLVAGAYSHLLTGYIGSLSFLRAVADAAATLRAGNPALEYGASRPRALEQAGLTSRAPYRQFATRFWGTQASCTCRRSWWAPTATSSCRSPPW